MKNLSRRIEKCEEELKKYVANHIITISHPSFIKDRVIVGNHLNLTFINKKNKKKFIIKGIGGLEDINP